MIVHRTLEPLRSPRCEPARRRPAARCGRSPRVPAPPSGAGAGQPRRCARPPRHAPSVLRTAVRGARGPGDGRRGDDCRAGNRRRLDATVRPAALPPPDTSAPRRIRSRWGVASTPRMARTRGTSASRTARVVAGPSPTAPALRTGTVSRIAGSAAAIASPAAIGSTAGVGSEHARHDPAVAPHREQTCGPARRPCLSRRPRGPKRLPMSAGSAARHRRPR